jgi:glycosyltransferase involved in cell wall biosynthesis
MLKVSICVPNLNQRPFIGERMESIVSQTFPDWECLVYDSFSDDGSWEIIRNYAINDGRIRAFQGPREGVYPAWNRLITEAEGELTYIATSDDTMTPDCLERMVAALETHPDCDICQCGLQMIDREGNPMTGADGGLCWETLGNASYFGDQLKAPHVRKAPHDGLVALAYGTVWTSITQVLIRRTLFQKVGLFPTNWGAVGDAAWQMKAGLVANVVYIPEKLATWRYYEGQGSGQVHQKALKEGWMHQMGLDALEWFDGLNPTLAKKIRRSGILDFFRLAVVASKWRVNNATSSRAHLILRHPQTMYALLGLRLNRFVGSVKPAKAVKCRSIVDSLLSSLSTV